MDHRAKNQTPLALKKRKGHSNTTHSKSYKEGCEILDLGPSNRILQIDLEKNAAIAEPQVTMNELVRATLAYGLMPPVVPEFRGITVGGAIMGGALESSSHKWGAFNDCCLSFEILRGDRTPLRATPEENADIFYGVAGSYGSFGALTKAEIRLIPAQEYVRLTYHFLSAKEALQKLAGSADFLEAIVFSKDLAVVIEGNLVPEADLPLFSPTLSSPWFYQHAGEHPREEIMKIEDYLFRHDQGAFWMGAYLFRNPYSYKPLKGPSALMRTLFHPLLTSKGLWKLLHLTKKWVDRHYVIQDFYIPNDYALNFLQESMEDPGIFPIWLCPIKGTATPQIFSPHFSRHNRLINIGIYGAPRCRPTVQVIRDLEKRAEKCQGRKMLYSNSFYTEEDFWRIYSKESYQALREKTKAEGVWQGIADKILFK